MAALPKEGDRYQARDNTTVRLLAMHGEAGMSFSDATMPRGELIEIDDNVKESDDYVTAVPVRYDDLESVLVPQQDLGMPRYGGYMLFIGLEQLAADFDRLSS
jgi:hypothetical protein